MSGLTADAPPAQGPTLAMNNRNDAAILKALSNEVITTTEPGCLQGIPVVANVQILQASNVASHEKSPLYRVRLSKLSLYLTEWSVANADDPKHAYLIKTVPKAVVLPETMAHLLGGVEFAKDKLCAMNDEELESLSAIIGDTIVSNLRKSFQTIVATVNHASKTRNKIAIVAAEHRKKGDHTCTPHVPANAQAPGQVPASAAAARASLAFATQQQTALVQIANQLLNKIDVEEKGQAADLVEIQGLKSRLADQKTRLRDEAAANAATPAPCIAMPDPAILFPADDGSGLLEGLKDITDEAKEAWEVAQASRQKLIEALEKEKAVMEELNGLLETL